MLVWPILALCCFEQLQEFQGTLSEGVDKLLDPFGTTTLNGW